MDEKGLKMAYNIDAGLKIIKNNFNNDIIKYKFNLLRGNINNITSNVR